MYGGAIAACCLVAHAAVSFAAPQSQPQAPLQLNLNETFRSTESALAHRKRPLYGRFLHITDFHPDSFYKVYSSTSEDAACHRGQGPAGIYGAETSECDSPIALINETFRWIEKEFRDSVDFVVWTGDSARHDNDEDLPRNAEQVIGSNEFMVDKMFAAFGKRNDDNPDEDDDPLNDFVVPIIPTFGNNDILPHNVMAKGPNNWLRTYARVWRQFIPEVQKHQFEQGGWFFVEVIPNKLAVFSLNTLYFFTSNAAANGCAIKSEPGFLQMEWLRIQLQFLRDRGMKAILTGHVPPVRQPAKSTWDETCWQKYTLWLQQYRDVVVTGLYGHFNYDHFMLQDFKQIDENARLGQMEESYDRRAQNSDVHAELSSDYWVQLRDEWAKLPNPPTGRLSEPDPCERHWSFSSVYERVGELVGTKKSKKSGKRRQEQKYLRKIGGRFAERFANTFVSASVVPNLYPTIRVFEYNVTGLSSRTYSASPLTQLPQQDAVKAAKKKEKKNKFIVPSPPSKTAEPGPAYSPQSLSLIKYIQYFANLTYINNDFHSSQEDYGTDKWREGKHHGKKPQGENEEPHPRKFQFELHYDTQDDETYRLKDLTMPSMVELARRIGAFQANSKSMTESISPGIDEGIEEQEEENETSGEELETDKNKDKKRKKKHKKKKHDKKEKKINLPWYTFVSRAFVETKDFDELREEFGK